MITDVPFAFPLAGRYIVIPGIETCVMNRILPFIADVSRSGAGLLFGMAVYREMVSCAPAIALIIKKFMNRRIVLMVWERYHIRSK
jgi:hypothetical protein